MVHTALPSQLPNFCQILMLAKEKKHVEEIRKTLFHSPQSENQSES